MDIPTATENLKLHIGQALQQAEGTIDGVPASEIAGCSEKPALPSLEERERLAAAKTAQEEAAARLAALAQKVMTLSFACSARCFKAKH